MFSGSQSCSSLNAQAVIKLLEHDFYRSDTKKTHRFAPINSNQIRGKGWVLLKTERVRELVREETW